MDTIQRIVYQNDLFIQGRFEQMDKDNKHLNTGMKHLYHMIKNEHPPNAEQKAFFEGEIKVGQNEKERGYPDYKAFNRSWGNPGNSL